MGLYREVLYSRAPILKHHNNFYGEMEEYQSLSAPTPEEIYKEQKRRLMEFQMLSFKNNNKTRAINSFLQLNGVIARSSNKYDQMVYERMNDIFQQINQMFQSGYVNKNTRNRLNEDKNLEKEIISKLIVLGRSLDDLRSQANMLISSSYIDNLNAIIKSLPGADVDLVLRTLYQIKGDLLEEIGTEWYNNRIPQQLNTKAFSAGSIKGKNGQLITDILVVDMDNIDLFSQELSFKIGSNGEEQTLSLNEFLKKVESYSGSEQIIIGSEGEDLLQKISLIGVQAKSGINQLPWNTGSKNTYATIQGENNQFDIYCRFLKHIEELRYSEKWNGEKNIKKESPAYKAMANYELAKSLSKVLHLSKMANQYVLTPNGFMPFVTRIMELYEKRKGSQRDNYYFSFGGRVTLEKEKNILIKARPVILGI